MLTPSGHYNQKGNWNQRYQRQIRADNQNPSELVQASQILAGIMGDEAYLDWTRTLPPEILFNPEEYLEVVESKLGHELVKSDVHADDCPCDRCTLPVPFVDTGELEF